MLNPDRTFAYRVRVPGMVNWIGFATLYRKEVHRFLKVYTQTLLAPMVTTLLYLLVFLVARGNTNTLIPHLSYGEFLGPGLVMMSVTQNAFANTSSSLMMNKVQGSIVDLMLPPLSAAEVIGAMALGGVTRGLMVGLVVAVAVLPFVPLHVAHWLPVLYFGFMASLMLSLLGILTGLWSEKFDHMAAVTNFVVMPLSFLSGTFYSVNALPPTLERIVRADPFFYMIDGFRYGFIDVTDAPVWVGAMLVAVIDAALLALCWRLYAIGYKLKA
jgi:ABC-2 type transport system permease protein